MAEMSILIIDDDESVIRSLGTYLRKAGYKVLAAMDGVQAMMTAQKEQPDLIIMDIMMPGGDGLTVLDRLRVSTKTMTTPVIIISAYGEEDIAIKAEQHGASKFFRKPYDIHELLKTVEDLLA